MTKPVRIIQLSNPGSGSTVLSNLLMAFFQPYESLVFMGFHHYNQDIVNNNIIIKTHDVMIDEWIKIFSDKYDLYFIISDRDDYDWNEHKKNKKNLFINYQEILESKVNPLPKISLNIYNKVNNLKNNTISSLIKTFLSVEIEEQRNILTLLLLLKDDIDTQYLAYLMYDMISNESYLLKSQPLSEDIYNSLHWTIQKLFKVTVKNIEKYNKTLLNFNESDIPYEKRIALLKVSDYVKSKAMEKYKEIIIKVAKIQVNPNNI